MIDSTIDPKKRPLSSETGPIEWKSTGTYKALGREMYHEFSRDRVTTLAAAVAYHTVFAIPAILVLVVLAAVTLNRVTDIAVLENVRELINERAPQSTRELLNNQVDRAVEQVGAGGLSIGIITTTVIALWSGSNAVGAMVSAFNIAYDVEEGRPIVKRKLLNIGLTLLLAVFVNLAFALLVFGERIGSWVADWIGAGSAFDTAWSTARWPLAVIAVGIFLALLYYLGPNVEQSFRWISPGSALATVLWLIATIGIGFYLRFSDPGSAYGVVGSVLVLLFFLYVTGIIFIVGAELNAILSKRADPKVINDLARKPEATPEARARARRQQTQMG